MITKPTNVLVTGATGFLGQRLAKRLVTEGYPVRAFARKQSNAGSLKELGVEITIGDLADESSVMAAVEGVDVVVHAAAGTSGTARDSDTATVQGTRNILDACRMGCIKKLVYISSCSVYEVAGYNENQVVTEEAQLERFPLRRGHYSAAKIRAEALVTEAMNHDGYPIVVLRPGTLYGPGGDVYTRMMGASFARRIFVVFGDGECAVPLLHVDNAVDSIVECMRNSAADNQVFNVVDQDLVTKMMYMEHVVKPLNPKAIVLYCPMSWLLIVTWVQEKLLTLVGIQPVLSVYRLVSSQKCVRYSPEKVDKVIGWKSRISFNQGAERLLLGYGRPAAPDNEQ
ncbi:MAG: NAD(P)-dependent oxidoreductase [Nitrospira sp.]|nr:NAD(P)-dependent oxidoreductase [Nitrospira sp.]